MTYDRQQREHAPWTPESERRYTRAAIFRARAASRPVLQEFGGWLEERGLGLGSIKVRIASARTFVDWVARRSRLVAQGLGTLTADAVERFFVGYGKDHGKGARRSMRSAMRLFLRFSAGCGWTPMELVDAVPSVSGYRLSGVPRGLSTEELSRLLSCLDDACARDRAIVYLLATYGVRRQQISALRLQDVDWPARSVTFLGHKRGKAIRHSLTPLVAASLATYLRYERPALEAESVFLRRHRPHLRLSPIGVTEIVRQSMVRAGLAARGPHALRHAFATRLLAAGQSDKAIADLLGHRSLNNVAVYAKVDCARLLEVSVEWPEAVS